MMINDYKKQNLDDNNNEIAGRDTGRIKRFLSDEARDHLEERKSGKISEKRSLLDILLMTDPVYAQLYSDVMEKIDQIDLAVNKALTKADRRIEHLETNLMDIQERANKLVDGTLIYKSLVGSVFTNDGISLSQQEVDGINWRESNPSWEERSEAGDALDAAYKKREEIEEYRENTLQHAKDRMNDADNPPDKEELQDILDDLDVSLPDSIENNMNVSKDISVQSNLMNQFQDKASGQYETQNTEYSQHHSQTENIETTHHYSVITP